MRKKIGNGERKEAIEIMKEAAGEISSENKVKIYLGVDFAADSFYNNGKYDYGCIFKYFYLNTRFLRLHPQLIVGGS